MSTIVPPEFEQFVESQIATGQYHSADEVISAGLRVLREITRRQEEFRREVQIGADQLDRGEGIELDQKDLRAFFDDIQARGQQRYEAAKKNA